MPLRKASKYNRFNVGGFMKEKRLAWLASEAKNRQLKAKKRQLSRIDKKVASVVQEVEDREDIMQELLGEGSSQGNVGKKVKRGVIAARRSIDCSERTRRRRSAETIKAAQEIHGGGTEDTAIGLLETVDSRCTVVDIENAVGRCKKLKEKVFPRVYKHHSKLYESSNENMLRSVAVYYSKGVMGKVKYRSVYKASSYSYSFEKKKAVRMSVASCPIPRLVPYHRLMSYIKSIDIGKLYSVQDTLCDGMDERDKVNGCYRNLEEVLLRLSEFYMCNDTYNLLTFTENNTFHIALGGDGAPFGKDDSACAWLVSFLNIGQGVLSSNENFLLFGGNCSESCLPVRRFLQKLLVDIVKIESTTYHVVCKGETIDVKFLISELPNDMKMLAFLGGELSNSAKYFSSFGDVSTDDMSTIQGTFGSESSNKYTWKPWNYSHRVKVAAQVVTIKKSLETKKTTEQTKRSKVTKFISQQKSRQEFVPLIGPLIDRAHVDPLHLKNNACALAHRQLLYLVCKFSLTCSKSFMQLPSDNLFFKYVETLRSQCNLSRLAKKVIKWFNETGGNGKEFEYRFTGKDSRFFLHNFMFLIDLLEEGSSGNHSRVLHIHSYLCICLRDAVSLFSRVEISDEDVSKLKLHCSNFFRGYSLFFNVNPTVWTLGVVVPFHTEEMKGKYGFGLGLNSMEGREAKHIAIANYSRNTAFLFRWEQIFRHEYISLIWLREKGYNTKHVVPSPNLSYIPKRVTADNSEFCNCGLKKVEASDQCRFCSHCFRTKVKNSIDKGKVLC